MFSKSRLNRLGLLLALALVQPVHAQLLRADLERPSKKAVDPCDWDSQARPADYEAIMGLPDGLE